MSRKTKAQKRRAKKRILIGASILIVSSIGVGALALTSTKSVVMDDQYKHPKTGNNNSEKAQKKHGKRHFALDESNTDNSSQVSDDSQANDTNSNPGPHTKEWYEDRRDEGKYQVWYSPDDTGDYVMVKNLETGQTVRKKGVMNPDWDYVHDRQIAYW